MVFSIEKRVIGQVRKALQEYSMISDGDFIGVGFSGGKDSLVLLYVLNRLQKFLDVDFKLHAIFVSLGFDDMDISPIIDFCNSINVPYTIEETLISKIVFDERKEKNPCSLCANMRRGALNNAAVRLGCNKVALGHNKDDLIETFMLSLLYEGRISSFSPVTFLSKTELHVIRPLILIEEKEIKQLIKVKDFKTFTNPCLVDGKTKRESIKQLINNIQKETKEVKSNIFGAIKKTQSFDK